jgi:RNA polymerase-binding transcription factor DksA
MAGGWAKDGAVQDQIDASVADAVTHARNQLTQGESREYCNECDSKIPQARRDAVTGVKYCIKCQEQHDKQQTQQQGFNRSGSKDSQLR